MMFIVRKLGKAVLLGGEEPFNTENIQLTSYTIRMNSVFV